MLTPDPISVEQSGCLLTTDSLWAAGRSLLERVSRLAALDVALTLLRVLLDVD